MVVTEADMERVLRELAELDKLETADELEGFIETSCNPLREMRRKGGGPERRAWPRTSRFQDFLIVLKPVAAVFAAGAVIFLLFLLSLDGVLHP